MSSPLVSVIIPNYNHEKYLKTRIESVLNQTFQDFEIIILDDCSTDFSVAILEKYTTHKKISFLLYNEKNSGNTFKQWIKGLSLCKGDYIWIAESDDFACKNFLKYTVRKLNASDKIGCVFAESIWIDDNNEKIANPKHKLSSVADMESSNFIINYMLDGNFIYNASAALFRKAAYIQNKETIDKNIIKYKACGDWLFWALILENYSIDLVYSSQNYFRRIESSVSAKSINSIETSFETINVIAFIKKYYKINLGSKHIKAIADKIITVYTAGRFNIKDHFFIYLSATKIHPSLPFLIGFKEFKRKLSRIPNPFKV
ncbi:glycosyltransferase family 2 protein [Pedobacter sp. Leaf170]|uniref:glycosyltransferase family 2 protein n=1 Tax=Pedobacter sp. Leaf170 TaxID=2876558 RepID=UPI001E414837|nr:glycosyltransferase family 2 protein [Pedobacter sp. Leaf170]